MFRAVTIGSENRLIQHYTVLNFSVHSEFLGIPKNKIGPKVVLVVPMFLDYSLTYSSVELHRTGLNIPARSK